MIWGETKTTSSKREVRVIEGSSYRRKITVICMTEFQGKSILVRVISARFELARVRVIGSQLYSPTSKFYVVFVGWSVTAVGGIPLRKQSLPCLKIGENFWPVTESVKLTHQFSETFTNTFLTNKLPSYLIYHNGTQDLGLKFVLSKSIKKVFFFNFSL